MSDVIRQGHSVHNFVVGLLSHNPIPQTAHYIHNNNITITLQYIPGDGFVVGFQDKRVSADVSPVMEFAHLHYIRGGTAKSDEDRMRELVMNLPVLTKEALTVKNDNDLGLILDRRNSQAILIMTITEVCSLAELHYNKNSRTLENQRPIYKKLFQSKSKKK